MAYSNYLLFNNIFLKNLTPSEEELAAARYLVHESARDWYREENFTSPEKIAEAWIKPLLNQQTLDLEPSELDNNAWFLVAPWDRVTPLALCYIAPAGTDLDGYTPENTLPKGQHWMIQAVNLALRQPDLNLRWVMLTNGVQWRLLDAHSLRRCEAYLEIDLLSLLNGEDDPLAAYLFYHIYRLEGSLERDPQTSHNLLDHFLEQSIAATEITEAYLKTTVSDNLAIPGEGDGIMAQLCMGFVHAADPTGAYTFTEDERADIYRDATYLLYRLLFILYAEARGLLPIERDDYRAISLNRLVDEAAEIRANPDKNSLTPTSLWDQLDILFNAIHYSDEYIGIPPYNGGLFESKDKPYLKAYKIENAYLAEGLFELAFLPDPKGEAPPERIDYRDLSVRHLGSLYEGMIEYQLFIAEEELLARRDKDGKVKYLPSAKNTRKPTDEIIQPGKVYFAQSPHERKATGTHYTPEDLVARLVKQTVGRLLDERWEAFQPNLDQWLAEIEATPGEDARCRLQDFADNQLEAFVHQQVLSLRICDPAMGSGHFLVFIAHTITNFILSALSNTPWENPAANLDPDYWRRLVVENCLYGVDINGMAVELAKLSLWLATMQLGQPLSFLDHHLKKGNSLLGVDLDEIVAVLDTSAFNQETHQTRVAEARGQFGFRELPRVQQKLDQANDLLARIATRRVERLVDIEAQEADYENIQALLKPYKQIGDLLAAQKMGWKVREEDLRSLAIALEAEALEMLNEQQNEILAQAQALLVNHRSFHWQLEFPLVFIRTDELQDGFNIVIGNPPFLGGMKISTELGDTFLNYLKSTFAPSLATTDLCAYFLRVDFYILNAGGYLGLVLTNTISQGDTREAGLAVVLNASGIIHYADRFVKWGGDANVEVNLIAITKAKFLNKMNQVYVLDGIEVREISSYLDDLPEYQPINLYQNNAKSFIGDYLQGTGFILEPNEAYALIESNPKYKLCIFPYLVGKELNNNPNQKPGRYVICFHDWTIEKAMLYKEPFKIIEERVKPTRMKIKRTRNRERWWLFAEYRKGLRDATNGLMKLLTRSAVSELHMLAFIDQSENIIFSKQLIVFAYEDYFSFSLLQSNLHEIWMRRFTSTMRTDTNYSPSDCFQTFPFPQEISEVNKYTAQSTGQIYYEYRHQIMQRTQLGLTKTYNRFHDPDFQAPDIQEMRRLHAEMDRAMLACYSWNDIDLQHAFYPNDRKKIRYMPSREAQREIFTRLLALNQEIAAREAAEGLVNEVDKEEDEDTTED